MERTTTLRCRVIRWKRTTIRQERLAAIRALGAKDAWAFKEDAGGARASVLTYDGECDGDFDITYEQAHALAYKRVAQ